MKQETITEIDELNNTVIKGGYCVGCGSCASLKNSPFKMKFDQHSKLQATLDPNIKSKADFKVLGVCPFSDKSKNEDDLGKQLFSPEAKKNDKIGYHLANYAGYVVEKNYRDNGSSGGMGSWILSELLSQNYVDSIIHVKQNMPKEEDTALFKYQLSTTTVQVQEGAKSRYYPIEISEIIKLIEERPGRYAIVGIPCFIKSIRLLSLENHILKERITYCIGLVCGHLKSAHFASMFSWQIGVHPTDLKEIDFRTKLANTRAVNYGVTVKGFSNGVEKEVVSPPVNELYGQNWGWGLFKYKACDFCDDVVAETADLTIGDAWLPQYIAEPKGTNIIIARNPKLLQLIQKGRSEGRIKLDNLDVADVIKSQKSGFFHRREGLSFRLHLKDKDGIWRPKKRVKASNISINRKKQKIQKLRMQISQKSHLAFQKALNLGSFSVFTQEMAPLISAYEKLYVSSKARRILSRLKRSIKNLFNYDKTRHVK